MWLYLSGDKNRRQVHTEQAGRRLLRSLKEQKPGHEYHLIKREGCVTTGWKKPARVAAEENGITLEWQERCSQELGIDTAAIQLAVAQAAPVAAAAAELWSSS